MATFANCLLNCWRKCRPDEKAPYVWVWFWVSELLSLRLCGCGRREHASPSSHYCLVPWHSPDPFPQPPLILFKGQSADRLCHPNRGGGAGVGGGGSQPILTCCNHSVIRWRQHVATNPAHANSLMRKFASNFHAHFSKAGKWMGRGAWKATQLPSCLVQIHSAAKANNLIARIAIQI